MVKIAPSILKADFMKMEKTIRKLEKGGSDYIHLDIMDGSFVDAITIGPKIVGDIKMITRVPLDVHLMIVNPDKHIEAFADAGADNITIHAEAVSDIKKSLEAIKNKGIKCAVSIKPNTPVESIENVLEVVDMVLIMTVEPGKGGQALIEDTLDKVAALKKIRAEKKYSFMIEVDGGISIETRDAAVLAGADVLVVGNAITSQKNYKKVIKQLKGI
ncbi:MAG: ribulose-phosphate 3-epimerase [Clostridia bacterium]|nr:ribulose-phosphate 3-epimerase [Clostridia bacterium]